MRARLFAILAMMILVAAQAKPQSAGSASRQSPEATAVAFYQWYLGELGGGKVPTDSLKGAMHGYITDGLTRRRV